jgi:hypothetical protein
MRVANSFGAPLVGCFDGGQAGAWLRRKSIIVRAEEKKKNLRTPFTLCSMRVSGGRP